MGAGLQLFYWQHRTRNFGDELNPWLMPRLFGPLLDPAAPGLLVGIGTLLNHKLPDAPAYHIFGSGLGYGDPPKPDARWHVHCVRGPRTAQALGLAADRAVTDPGALVARHWTPPRHAPTGPVFMPHHDSAADGLWPEVCRRAGLGYIDPSAPVETVLTQLARAPLVLTEAMHGAICADALRTPWVALAIDDAFLEAKWQDWAGSLTLDLRVTRLQPTFRGDAALPRGARLKNRVKRALWVRGLKPERWTPPIPQRTPDAELDRRADALVRLVQTASPQLSEAAVLTRLLDQLEERADGLRRVLLHGSPESRTG